LYNKNSFFKKHLSYNLQPGLYKIFSNKDFFKLEYNQSPKLQATNSTFIPIFHDRALISCSELDFQQLLKFQNETILQLDWDKIDEIKTISLKQDMTGNIMEHSVIGTF
jgi:hypothetical protein